jgi:predicted nucleic acid-binding protein
LKVFLDTNVVLDVLLAREPWREAAERIWLACDEGRATGHVAATTLTNIFYVARKHKGAADARRAVEILLEAFEIVAVDRAVVAAAVALNGQDFEDDIQIACAHAIAADVIVTRDSAGFARAAPTRVVAPDAWTL